MPHQHDRRSDRARRQARAGADALGAGAKLERRKRKAKPRTMTVHARVTDAPKTYKEICDAVKRDAPKLS